MYKLQLFHSHDPDQVVDARLFAEGCMTIGRDPEANWSIEDPTCAISRWHCDLFARSEGLMLYVKGANGVFYEGSEERLPDGAETLLPLPCSLALGEFRLLATVAPFAERIGDGNMTMLLAPPVGTSIEVPSNWSDAAPTPDMIRGSLLEVFCQGAGLDLSLLSDEPPEEVMQRAGAIFRQMVLGIGDLMAERDRARGRFEMSRTTISGASNNPFKWAPTQRLAVDLLLSGQSSFLSGPAAVQASFRDLKRHLVATFAGLHGSLRTAVDTFSPATLDSAVPERLSFLKNRAAAQIDEVRRRHEDLVAQIDEGVQGSLDRAFVQAYAKADTAPGTVK